VDGTLKGVEENSNSMLPQWKRGHFSLLFDGSTSPNTMLLLDHVRGSYIDLAAEKKANKPDLESEVRCHASLVWNFPCSSVFWSQRYAVMLPSFKPDLESKVRCDASLVWNFPCSSVFWSQGYGVMLSLLEPDLESEVLYDAPLVRACFGV
jgi:GPCR-chaperone